jgi:hypothetical protein
MHATATPDEVRLRKGSSLSERLVWAGSGGAVLLIVVPGLVTWASGGPPLAAAFWAVPLGIFLIGVAALESNVVWIVTPDGIAIGEQRPMGQVRKRLIGIHDIADVSVCKNRFSYPKGFSLRCRLASGDVLVSPPLPDITRVNETAATVARLLNLPDTAFVDNPFDAANTEIVLRSPVSLDVGWLIRMAVPLLATLCSLPFLVAFGIGESELALGLLLPLGLIVAIALYRYTHRLSGARWIIRHGEVYIERMTWTGRPSAETIRADDVAGIEVDKPDTKGRTCTISIRLRSGQTFRSPTRHDEDGARALRAEIIRRLNIFPNSGSAG